VSLREAFDESIQTAAMGESTDLATALLPRDDVVDAFLANGGPGLRLRALGEAIDSKSRAIKGDLPFRRLTADPQFTADTIVQKGLRTAGLTSPQTKFLMESLTAHERAALSVTIDPLSETFEAGNLPLSEAMARAVERVAGPEKQALVKRLVAEGSAHSDKFKDLLKTSLKGFDLEAPTEEAIQTAATRLDDVIEEEPMLGILLPKLFDDTVTPGQAVRMATHVNPPPSIVKSPLRKAISKGTTSLFNFLRNTRMAGMLTSLTAPMKNITFTGININANVAGRAVAGIGSKRVYRGEALAMVKGLIRGVQDNVATYGAMGRFLRESEQGTRLGFLSFGSDILKAQDRFFFRKTFAAEMHAEAYKKAVKSGMGWREALKATDDLIDKEFREFGPVFEAAKAKARKLAAADQIEDNNIITRNAVKLLRNAGEEPISIQESRLMAERAIFVAREGRNLDKFLSVIDSIDTATNGAIGVVSPFRRTPANEIREFVRASGGDILGLGMRRIKQDVATGVPEEIARTRFARDYGKAVVGAGITSTVMFGLAHGLISVGDDEGKSRAQIDTERAQGIPRRSVRMGDWIIPMHVMGPIGRIVNQADILLRNKDENLNVDAAFGEIARQVTGSLSEDFLTSDWVGFSDALDSKEGMQRFAQRFGASFVPGILKQGKLPKTGAQAEIRRPNKSPRGPLEAIASGFLTELEPFTQPVKEKFGIEDSDRSEPIVGLFGQTAKEGTAGSRVIGAPKKNDLIARTAEELQRLGLYKEAPDTNIPNVEWLGLEETEFAKAKGALQLQAVRRVMDHPKYQSATDQVKAKLVNAEMRKASRLANGRARVGKARGFPITGRFILSGRIGP
jgi:hypothetical protein